jgi:MFS family permease
MAVWKPARDFLSSIGADVLWQSNRDLKILILLRFIRLLGYGGTTLVLALYLNALGFKDTQIGLFMTLTLVGDLAISFFLTWFGDRVGVRFTAAVGALLMCAGGIAFPFFENFWLLLFASIVAVINPRYVDHFLIVKSGADCLAPMRSIPSKPLRSQPLPASAPRILATICSLGGPC